MPRRCTVAAGCFGGHFLIGQRLLPGFHGVAVGQFQPGERDGHEVTGVLGRPLRPFLLEFREPAGNGPLGDVQSPADCAAGMARQAQPGDLGQQGGLGRPGGAADGDSSAAGARLPQAAAGRAEGGWRAFEGRVLSDGGHGGLLGKRAIESSDIANYQYLVFMSRGGDDFFLVRRPAAWPGRPKWLTGKEVAAIDETPENSEK